MTADTRITRRPSRYADTRVDWPGGCALRTSLRSRERDWEVYTIRDGLEMFLGYAPSEPAFVLDWMVLS